MNYDELQELKIKIQKFARGQKYEEALSLIYQCIKIDQSEQIIQFLLPLIEKTICESENCLKLLKLSIQLLQPKFQFQVVQTAFSKFPKNPILTHWICELDSKQQYVQLSVFSAFIVQNYIKNCYFFYFFNLLVAQQYNTCEQVLKLAPDQMCEHFYQAVVRQNLSAFKVIRITYKEQIQTLLELVNELQAQFPDEKQKENKDELD